MTLKDIVTAIEAYADPALQESWDNTGWQIAPMESSDECSGVMLCLDVTPAVVEEAKDQGCNLIVSHHPKIFKGLRSITGASQAERAVILAIRHGIAVYSSHTALDSAPLGVSRELGSMLGLTAMQPLVPDAHTPSAGLGVIGIPEHGTITSDGLIDAVKRVYNAPRVRVTRGIPSLSGIHKVALSSGSGGEFIPAAIAAGAEAYISSDIRYHDFLDHGRDILIIDTGHFESEICTKSIFSRIISQKFPNFAVHIAKCEHNPVTYV